MVPSPPSSPSVPGPPGGAPAPVSGEGPYGLDALLALAGERLGEEISSRTVRLYATQGLIDRPGREGRSAVYGHRHLLQLLLIRSLARRGLSLSAIAPLCVLPNAELERQLQELEASSPEAAAAEPEARDRFRRPALDYLASLRHRGVSDAQTAPPSPADEAGEASAPARTTRSLLPLLGAPLPSPSPGAVMPSAAVRREASSRWHRFTLMPGVELHVSDAVVVPPAGSRRRQWLRRLAERLTTLLDASDP